MDQKICKDCRHVVRPTNEMILEGIGRWQCKFGSTKHRDLVTGEIVREDYKDCRQERTSTKNSSCGPSGQFWSAMPLTY